MSRALLRSCLFVASCLTLIFAVIYLLDIGKIRPIDGAVMIKTLEECDTADCTETRLTALPYATELRPVWQSESHDFLLAVPPQSARNAPMALYFPKLSDSITIRAGDRLIYENYSGQGLWNTPLLVMLPDDLRAKVPLQLRLTLTGLSNEGLDLHPFFYGPRGLLAPHQAMRHFFGLGLARFGLGLMGVLAIALLVVWGFRRQEQEYLWLGLACATATLTLLQYGYGHAFGGYRLWTALWPLAVSLYVLLIMKFVRQFLGLSLKWPEHLHSGFLAVAFVGILLSPPDYTFILAMWLNVLITIPSAFIAVVILWTNRGMLTPLDLRVFFLCLSIAVALGFYALYLFITNTPSRSMHLFHMMPLVMSLACIWLILSRLIHSLRGYEALTASLNQTIARKSAELENSFAELAEVKRREAIAEERDRIMLDLHDGIGGQLVSTLAYMEGNNAGDEKIRRALEDALRDLALMLDSMENHDSLVTLLGMLRTRLEGLLSEHGIEFDWQVHGEPELSTPGPSQSLHLARIIQEAITNVVKHTKADTITVYVDEQEIRVSDNGGGFDLEQQATNEHPANGIANMRRRAASIDAKFNLVSEATGTHISLLLK